jgi:hypothetical protein
MDFNLPPPSPEQWTQAVLGVTGGAALYGGAMVVARVKRWFSRRAIEKLQAALYSPSETAASPAEAVPDDPVVERVLHLLAGDRDGEWSIEPYTGTKAYAYCAKHPSGAQFVTDKDREVSGPDAVFEFKFGSLHLFDRTMCIGAVDMKRIRQAAWDMASRIARKRVLDAVEPKKEETKVSSQSGCLLSVKFGQVVHRMHAGTGNETPQKVEDAAERIEQTVKDTGYRWVVFKNPSGGVRIEHHDADGDPVWSIPQAEAATAHAAAEKFTVYAANGGKLPVADRCFSLWRYDATTRAHWTARSAGYGGYSWNVVGCVPLLRETPTARFRVLRADGATVFDEKFAVPWCSVRQAAIEYVCRQPHPKLLSDAIVFVVTDDELLRPVGYLRLSKLLD